MRGKSQFQGGAPPPRKPDAGRAPAPAKAFVMADVGRKIGPPKPTAKPASKGKR